jgi:hypothetical protein
MRSEHLFGSATTAALHGLCLAFLDWIFRLSGPSTMRGTGGQRSLVPVSTSDKTRRRGGIEWASQPPKRTDNHKRPAMP